MGSATAARGAGLHALPPTTDTRPFFTIKTLAAYLSISERSVYGLLSSRQISSYKIAGTRRIAAHDVDAYLERQRA